jgi:tRNA G18 (ribose-2'-O)-methylase SpoU
MNHKKVLAIYQKMMSLQSQSLFSQDDLLALQQQISALALDKNPDVARLHVWSSHLHPQMTAKHLFALTVPFERVLRRQVKDDDFLIKVDDQDRPKDQGQKAPLHFILENWRSAFNVGSLFRTAETLGAEKIHLCGYTPTPDQAKVEKTGLGSQEWIHWQYQEDIAAVIKTLQLEKITVIGLETADLATSIYEPLPAGPTAFVIGNERFGLEMDTLKACDQIRIIPMQGKKNSLNAAVAGAIAGFEWRRQYDHKKS